MDSENRFRATKGWAGRALRFLVPRALDQTIARLRLVVALMLDQRIKAPLKLLPLLPLVYLVLPDFLPGPIDDAALLWLGVDLFVRLSPPEIVAEHQNRLRGVIDGKWVNGTQGKGDPPLLPPLE